MTFFKVRLQSEAMLVNIGLIASALAAKPLMLQIIVLVDIVRVHLWHSEEVGTAPLSPSLRQCSIRARVALHAAADVPIYLANICPFLKQCLRSMPIPTYSTISEH